MKKANFLNAQGALKALLVMLMAMAFNYNASAQCTLTCNNNVQISLDQTCTVTLVPDQVLEGDDAIQCPGVALIVQRKQPNGQWVAGVLTAADINKTITVRVIDPISGQNCWGTVSVEDKLAPVINCVDATISCAAFNPAATNYPRNIPGVAVPTAIDNCSGALTPVFTDNYTDLDCTAPFSGLLTRTWSATDASGNTAVCTQLIRLARATLAQVTCPVDAVLSCTTPFTADANGNPTPAWMAQNTPLGAAAPHIAGTYIFPTVGACELNTSYTDQNIPVCDGTRKILRTWTIIDWCTPTGAGNPLICTQLIKIEDTTVPVFTCPSNMTVSTNPFDCERDLDLPDVIIEDACSRIRSIKAQYAVNGITYNINGALRTFPGNNLWTPDTLGVVGIANNLPIGNTTVTYTVTDDCGNASTCSFRVTVEDQTPPVAICDEHTVVSMGFNGTVRVPASVLDDGSYDNCGPVYFKVRRMQNNTCDPSNRFDDFVEFCCEDAGDTITVVFRVYDQEPAAGEINLNTLIDNSNDCMVQVVVQDKLRPVCTAPANVTVDCENFDPSLWAYGYATGVDNCCLDTVTVANNFAQFDTTCNTGRIIRTFRATDCTGLTSTCTQSVTVNYRQDYYLKFPDDVRVTVCDGTGNYGEPILYDEDCELLGVSYTDEIFTVVPDACYKIERTWKVNNWCTYDSDLACEVVLRNPAGTGPRLSPFAPLSGHPHAATNDNYYNQYLGLLDNQGRLTANCFVYKQIIKIVDGVAPTATTTQPVCDKTNNDANFYNDMAFYDASINSHDLCEGPADLSINATDLCSGANVKVRYLLFLDLDGDGNMETVINSLNPPATSTINVGNASNPNFSGGTPVVFDGRPVPAARKYRFGLKQTTSGNSVNASVAWKEDRDFFTASAGVTPELPYGTHKIKWIVEDGCGNELVQEFSFTIEDCKKPTVVCKNGISVNLMNASPSMVTLWASDFLKYAEDNCTPAEYLKVGICLENNPLAQDACTGSLPLNPNGTPDTSVTFNCSHEGFVVVQVWAQDVNGNEDFCRATVSVQDNMGVCNPNFATVTGALEAGTNGLEEANVNLVGTAFSRNTMTNNQGKFDFLAVPTLNAYDVVPNKNDDMKNGIDVNDMLAIQKHILGSARINNSYRLIAADVNKSGDITATDIVELRKLLLGLYDAGYDKNNSWRFVDQSYVFPTPNNPFATAFPEMISIASLSQGLTTGMFEAVKVGDVNGDAVANASTVADDRFAGTLVIDAKDAVVAAGDVVTVEFNAASAQGYQFTMNHKGLEVVELIPGANMTDANFAVFNEKSALTAVVDANAGKFAITFRATANGKVSEMLSLGNSITRTLAVDAEGNRNNVALRFNGVIASAGFELMQNVPNPVSNVTNISFMLPEAAAATLKITNAEGRVIRTVNGDFAKGMNTIQLDRADLETGVLFYQLDTPTNSATKKMVVIQK